MGRKPQIPEHITIKNQERYDRDKAYLESKRKKINKEFNNPLSDLRKIADYLNSAQTGYCMNPMSYKDLAKAFGISEAKAKQIVGSLNQVRGYPLKFVPSGSRGKGSCFQSSRTDLFTTEKSIQRRERCIASQEQSRIEIEHAVGDLLYEKEQEAIRKLKEKTQEKMVVKKEKGGKKEEEAQEIVEDCE